MLNFALQWNDESEWKGTPQEDVERLRELIKLAKFLRTDTYKLVLGLAVSVPERLSFSPLESARGRDAAGAVDSFALLPHEGDEAHGQAGQPAPTELAPEMPVTPVDAEVHAEGEMARGGSRKASRKGTGASKGREGMVKPPLEIIAVDLEERLKRTFR